LWIVTAGRRDNDSHSVTPAPPPHVPREPLRPAGADTSTRHADRAFAVAILASTALAASVWWLSEITPGQDYPQFLVFVRAFQDLRDPASGFHGTYDTAAWYVPTSLPVHLTAWLALAAGGSIELAGRLLLTAQNVGLVAASLLLLNTLGRPRWALVLIFPLIHSAWTVVGGFFAFATAMPLLILGWALTVRWLTRPTAGSGLALALTLSATLFWHGIAYAQLGLAFAVLWALWRAPSWRARARSLAPTAPSLLQCAAWLHAQFGASSTGASWRSPGEAARRLVESVWATVPAAPLLALAFGVLVGAALALRKLDPPSDCAPADAWRAHNPLLVVAIVYALAYFALPLHLYAVEGLSNRFAYPAALAFAASWELPGRALVRRGLLAAALALGAFGLGDVALRFRAFDRETRGASALIDRVGPRETLYFWPDRRGEAAAFAPAPNKAMIELEQFATIRHGGLPNSSLAGYGFNYVRYVDGRNPMPGLYGPPNYRPGITRFDYVLVRSGGAPLDARFRLVDHAEGWELYGVCGSARLRTC
jgi:hypothetical protein